MTDNFAPKNSDSSSESDIDSNIAAKKSAEVYGFNKDSSTNSNLIVTTTNQGVDNISKATFANFDDVLFSASGFTFTLSNGDLIANI